jgi:high-affinity iron transporter
MRKVSAVLLLIAAVILLAVAGCGGDDDESAEESATPAEAVAEIEEIKTLLATAVQQVRDGDQDAAEKTVGDAYLEHFEEVEGPLGERDHEFMEELEEAISTDLRNDIKDGKSADEIQAEVDEIDADLDRAVELLQG